MQMLGLACIAALAPPAFWGWRLLTERRLERPAAEGGPLSRRRGGGGGAGLAPSRAGELAAADRTRRGRRRCPARSAAPSVCRLDLGHGGDRRGLRGARDPRPDRGLRRRLRSRAAPRRTGRRRRQKRPAAPRPASTTKRAEDEPGFAMVSIGAVIHALLTAKAVLRRLVPPPAEIASQGRAVRAIGRGGGSARALARPAAPTTMG